MTPKREQPEQREGPVDTGQDLASSTSLNEAAGRLQSTREEYETTVEELRAANEELQSTNEEYRSTLEELETSKEELQSINEELQTVNQELKHKVEETAQAHNDLQNLFAAAEIATLFLDRDLRIRRYTPQAADLFNLMPPDRGRPIGHLRSNLIYDELEADAHQVLAKLAPVERDVQGEDERWFQVDLRPYRTVEDKIDGVVITFVDITANKEVEQALRQSEERLRRLVNIEEVAVLTFDLSSGTLIDANDTFLHMFGYSREEVEAGALTWRTLTPPEYIAVSEQQLQQLEKTGRIGPYEKEYLHKDGLRSWMLFVGADLGDGTVVEYGIDVGDRKQAEEALRQSEAFFRTLFDETLDALLLANDEGVYVDANSAASALLGYDHNELQGKTVMDLSAMDEAVFREMWDTFLQEGRMRGEYQLRTKQGDLIDVEFNAVANVVPGWHLSSLRDITARKRAEEALRQSQERLAAALSTARMASWEWDPEKDLTIATDTTSDVFGLLPGETLDSSAYGFRLVHPDDVEHHRALVRRASERGEDWHTEFRIIRPRDGEIAWLEERAKAIRDPETGKVRITGLVWDITERKRAEEALAAELASIQRLQELGTRLLVESDLGTLLDEIMDAAIEITGADKGNMQLLDPMTGELRIRGQRGFESYFLEFWGRISDKTRSACAKALKTSKRVVVPDVESSDLFAGQALDVMLQAGVRAMQSTPLLTRSGETLGMISTHWRQPHEPDAHDLHMLDLLVRQAADLIERAQAEAALRRSREELEIALEAAGMGTWDVDLSTGKARTDLRHNRIFGYPGPIADWGPDVFREHILPEDREKFDEGFARAMETGELNLEVRVRWPDGSVHWIHDRGRVDYDEDGTPVRMTGVTMEITDRKEAELAEIRQRIIRGQEAERSHLAREIHDGPVQELAALTFQIASVINQMDGEERRTSLAAINANIEQIIRELRQIMSRLRPPAVVDFGLVSAIRNHVQEVYTQHPDLTVSVDLDQTRHPLSEEMVLALYRICQQALYNVITHAEADQARVRLHRTDDQVTLEIEDDGKGFVVPDQWVDLARRRHLGIVGMIERAEAIGGEFELHSTPGAGTLVRVTVPVS